MFCAESEPSRCRFHREKQCGHSACGLFFSAGPISADPVLYLIFVSFNCSAFRTLRRQAQGVQQATDMIDMIRNIESVPNQLGDSGTSPEVGRKSRGLRSSFQPSQQSLFVCRFQTRRSAWCGFGSYPRYPLGLICRFPATNTASISPHSLRYRNWLQTLIKKLHRSMPTFLKFFWPAGWSHFSPPTDNIGHLLYRSQ